MIANTESMTDAMLEEGIDFEELHAQVPHVPAEGLWDAIHFLSSEGYLYATVDENHFKAKTPIDGMI